MNTLTIPLAHGMLVARYRVTISERTLYRMIERNRLAQVDTRKRQKRYARKDIISLARKEGLITTKEQLEFPAIQQIKRLKA
mgnify:CR=1 FL=1